MLLHYLSPKHLVSPGLPLNHCSALSEDHLCDVDQKGRLVVVLRIKGGVQLRA